MLPDTVATFRTINPAILASQQLAQAGLNKTVEKATLARVLKRTAPALRITGTAYHVLDILLGLVQKRDLLEGAMPIVAISNEKLAEFVCRSTRSVSRALKTLVEAGILAYKDSPNGRRFVKRNQGGKMEYGYGLDFAPACHKIAELEKLADNFHERLKQDKQAKRAITSKARSIADMGEFLGVAFEEIRTELNAILAAEISLNQRCDAIGKLHAHALSLSNQFALEIETKEQLTSEKLLSAQVSNLEGVHTTKAQLKPSSYLLLNALEGVSIGLLELASKEVTDVLEMQLSNWSDLFSRCDELRLLIGLSEAGWVGSCSAQGKHLAAACLLIVAEKSLRDPLAIERPAGYFTAMIARAKEGKLNLARSIHGLIGL